MAQNKQETQRTIMILLGVVVILLVAIVSIVIYTGQQKNTPVAAVGSATGTGAAAAGAGATGQPTQANPGMAPSTGAAFDAKTATKLPAGTTPDKYVAQYYQSILDKKFDVAFKMQPASSQQGTVADFTATQQGYGMSAFKIVSSNIAADTATVDVEQDLGTNGKWGALWTIKKVGSDWFVESRKISMK